MAADDTLLDIPVVELTEDGLRSLESLSDDPSVSWYKDRRLRALRAAGLIASFDPQLHPRGHDGKFIEKFGFVRWLVNGEWKRGQVTMIEGGGANFDHKPNIKVRASDGSGDRWFTASEASKSLYSLPKPKANLKLPDPKYNGDAPGFTKIGGQSGSNPGGLYEVTSSTEGNINATASTVKAAVTQLNLKPGVKLQVQSLNLEADQEIPNIRGMLGMRAVIMDDETNRVWVYDNGAFMDMISFQPAAPEEIFGMPGSDRRLDVVIHDLRVIPAIEQEDMINLNMTVSGMVQNRPVLKDRFYVKTGKSADHARNEKLANDLYEMGGVAVPEVGIGADGVTVGSKIVTGDKIEPLSAYMSDDAVMSKIREDMVFDAWLANWDVVGLGYDNILIVDGLPVRVDAGGSLKYRAQGSPKGSHFTDEVVELDSFISGMNPQAKKVFGKVTPAELKSGGERLAAISPAEIRAAALNAGYDDDYANKLISRRKSILTKLKIDEPLPGGPDPGAANFSPIEPPETDLTDSTWSPTMNQFVKGQITGDPLGDYTNFINTQGTPASAAAIAKTYNTGEILSIVNGDNLWVVEKVRYDAPSNSYEFELEHAATGRRKQAYYTAGALVPALVGSTPITKYENLYGARTSKLADELSTFSEADLYDLTGNPDASGVSMNDYIVDAAVQIHSGMWLRRASNASSEHSFIKLMSSMNMTGNKTGNLKFMSLDGTPIDVNIKDLEFKYTQADAGSFAEDVLNAAAQRNSVAKVNASIDLGDEAPNVLTGHDAAMVSLASLEVKPVSDITSQQITSPPPPAINEIHVAGEDVNSRLTLIGEPFDVNAAMSLEDAKAMVGKKFFFSNSPTKSDYQRRLGVWRVDSVQASTNDPTKLVTISVVSPMGHHDVIGLGQQTEAIQVVDDQAPIMSFQLKKDGTVNMNGVTVGSWKPKDPHGWGESSKFRVTINAEHSVNGKDIKIVDYNKARLKPQIISMTIPPGSGGAREKSAAVKTIEAKVHAQVEFGGSNETSPEGTTATLLDGAKAKEGMWVISKNDGAVGKIKWIQPNTGYVVVEMDDGSSKGRASSTLSAASAPTGELPPPSPVYAGVKLKDGTQPFPSQKVQVSGGEGTVIQIKPDGAIRIANPDGTKTWTNSTKVEPIVSYKEQSVAEIVATAPTFKGAKEKPSAKAQYPAPGGVTIPQAPNAVERYREFAPGRILTRDGFVPQIGMKVRDSKGKQYTIVRIGETTSGNPSAVWLLDEYGALSGRTPSRLWVDHHAELATADGSPLPKVSGISFSAHPESDGNLPTGTIIYKIDGAAYTEGRTIKVDQYVASLPNGSVKYINSGNLGGVMWHNKVADAFREGTPVRVAYVDEQADSIITIDEGGEGYHKYASAVWVHKNDEGALEELKHEVAEAKIAQGVVEPEQFEGSQKHLVALPTPSKFKNASKAPPTPAPPSPSGDKRALSVNKGPVQGSYSVQSGYDELMMRSDADEGKVNQAQLYAMSDSDSIEDMAVRMQLAVDENNDEYVEIRFMLLEDKVDDTAGRLIQNNGDVVGSWTRTTAKQPSQLVDGDAVSVRISSKGALKPGSDNSPNATVVGVPESIGVTKAGFPAYKVVVQVAGGSPANLILEERSTGSINIYEWDPTKVTYGKKFNGQLNPEAALKGWSVAAENSVGYEAVKDLKGVLIDAKGRRIIRKDEKENKPKNIASLVGAMRARYDHPSGGWMTVQMVHPSAEERGSADSNRGRRSSVNGEVLIRVKANDPNAMQAVSDMMAAVGIPPEKQGAPSEDDLVNMAMNKVARQFGTSYSHMSKPNVAGAKDTTNIQRVLTTIDNAVGAQLGRKATIDDIHLRTMADGRVTVVLSDDVADAVAKKVSFTGAYHSFTGGGYKDQMVTGKGGTGLMSTDERWSQGILTSGMSSVTDVTNDAGNRVYLRFINSGQSSSVHGGSKVFLSGREIAKNMDWYWNTGDHFGKRGSNNLNWLNTTSFGGSNEVMFKRKLDLEIIGYITFGSQSARQEAIDSAKKAGVTEINGRPIEDVMIVEGSKTVGDLNKIVNPIPEVPLGSLLVTVPAVGSPI